MAPENSSVRSYAPYFFDRAWSYLETWPENFLGMVREPHKAMVAIPEKGTWEYPIVLAATAGFFSGFIQFLNLIQISAGFGLMGFFSSVIGNVLGIFVMGFLCHFLLGSFGKEPGAYKTTTFFAILSPLGPVSLLLSVIHPIFGTAVSFFFLYQIFLYAQVVSKLSQGKAAFFVLSVMAIFILTTLFFGLQLAVPT